MDLNIFEIKDNELISTYNKKNENGKVLYPEVFNYLLKLIDCTLVYNDDNTYSLKNLSNGKKYNSIGNAFLSNKGSKFKVNDAIVDFNDKSIVIERNNRFISVYNSDNKMEFRYFDKKKNVSFNVEISFNELIKDSNFNYNNREISSLKFYAGYDASRCYDDTEFCLVCEPSKVNVSSSFDNFSFNYDELEKNVPLLIEKFNTYVTLSNKIKVKNKDLKFVSYIMYDFINSFLNTTYNTLLNNNDYLIKLFNNRKKVSDNSHKKSLEALKQQYEENLRILKEQYEEGLKKIESSYHEKIGEFDETLDTLIKRGKKLN